MSLVQVENLSTGPYHQDRPVSVAVQALGASSFTGNIELRFIVSSDRASNLDPSTRMQKFAALNRWSDGEPNPLDQVSPGEKDILGLTTLGMPDSEIASRVMLSEQPVKFHRGNIHDKFGTTNKAQLGKVARRAGVLHRAHADMSADILSREGYAATRIELDKIDFVNNPSSLPTDDLTSRESEILGLLLEEGLTNPEISRRLQVLEQTVKFHFSNIFEKMGVRNRNEATLVGDFASVGVAVRSIDGRNPVEEDTEPASLKSNVLAYVRKVLAAKAVHAMSRLDQGFGFRISGEPSDAGLSMNGFNLALLEQMGILTREMIEERWVDLPAAILEEQLRDMNQAVLLANSQYTQIALEAATNAAYSFLSGQVPKKNTDLIE